MGKSDTFRKATEKGRVVVIKSRNVSANHSNSHRITQRDTQNNTHRDTSKEHTQETHTRKTASLLFGFLVFGIIFVAGERAGRRVGRWAAEPAGGRAARDHRDAAAQARGGAGGFPGPCACGGARRGGARRHAGAMYYIKNATSEASRHKYHVYLEGGGWCTGTASCVRRALTVLGSSSPKYQLINTCSRKACRIHEWHR